MNKQEKARKSTENNTKPHDIALINGKITNYGKLVLDYFQNMGYYRSMNWKYMDAVVALQYLATYFPV